MRHGATVAPEQTETQGAGREACSLRVFSWKAEKAHARCAELRIFAPPAVGRNAIRTPLELEEYILSVTTPEHPYLRALYRATQTTLLRPRMASGHLQGQLLRMLCQLSGARRVVEIGTYSGYSALAMASGMPAGGEITTFEINDEQEDFTRPWIEGSPFAAAINFVIGDAFALLSGPYAGLSGLDLGFIDADKRQYVDYYELLLPRLRPGGLLLADNTLWDGHVVDERYRGDAQTEAILRFNRHVAADERVEQVLLPLRDGLTLIRKR